MKKHLLALAIFAAAGVAAHASTLGVQATAQFGVNDLRMGAVSANVDELAVGASKAFGAAHIGARLSEGQGQGIQEHDLSLVASYDIAVPEVHGLTVSPLVGLGYQAIDTGAKTGYAGRYATDRWVLGAGASMPIAHTGVMAHAELAAGRTFAPSSGSGGLYELASVGVSTPAAGGALSLDLVGSRANMSGLGEQLDQNRIEVGYTHAF